MCPSDDLINHWPGLANIRYAHQFFQTTARHESTGMSGKIQCSSILYEHLAEYSANSQGPLYDFTPRGFVDMKGKSRCYTYWLDKGTKYNDDANPDKIKQLCKEVKSVLSKKKWLKRKYFGFTKRRSTELLLGDDASTRRGSIGLLDDDVSSSLSTRSVEVPDEGSITTAGDSSAQDTIQADATTLKSSVTDADRRSSDHDTVSFTEVCVSCSSQPLYSINYQS